MTPGQYGLTGLKPAQPIYGSTNLQYPLTGMEPGNDGLINTTKMGILIAGGLVLVMLIMSN